MSFSERQIANLYDWYADLENRLTTIIQVFPITDFTEAGNVYTPRLNSVLVESGAIADSLFRKLFPNNARRRDGKPIKRDRAVITDYYLILEPSLRLVSTTSLLMTPVPAILKPFEGWTGRSSPNWWKQYNSLKHDRLSNKSSISLTDAVSALCALHQLMTKVSDILKYSLRFGWVQTGGYNPDVIFDYLQTDKMPFFLAYTKIFCTPLQPVSWSSDRDIKPFHFENRERLMTYLGRMT